MASGSDEGDEWTTVPKKSSKKTSKRTSGNQIGEEKVWTHSYEPILASPHDSIKNVQSILMLVGLPGSGKSTFATELCRLLPWKYVRLNQDELKTRNKCIAAAEEALTTGISVVIDRCNFDRSQREPFLRLGTSHGDCSVTVDCIVFDVDTAVCIQRCQKRRGHPTLGPGQAPDVVERLARQVTPPRPDEGFRTIRYVGELVSSLERALGRLMEEALGIVDTDS